MNTKLHDCELVLIDFDGVISKNILPMLIDASYAFINKHIPTPYAVHKQGIKASVCLPVQGTMESYFASLGFAHLLPDFYRFMMDMDAIERRAGETVAIEKDFFRFTDFLQRRSLGFRIFSLADKSQKHFVEIAERFGQDIFYNIDSRSKQSIKTYRDLAAEFSIEPEKVLLIDDAGPALRAAKMVGMQTIMMCNSVFTEEDADSWNMHIDHVVTSFTEIEALYKA